MAPAAILVALTLLSVPMWSNIKLNIPQGDLVLNVAGKQFNWEVTYPGPDGKFGTEDDKTLLDEMHVPINKVVRINLRGRDVIHSFFVPQFRFKQDAVPGRSIAQWFEVTKPGKYEAPCAELCGIGHSGMKAWVYAHTPADYEKWAAENLQGRGPGRTGGGRGCPRRPDGGESQAMSASSVAAHGHTAHAEHHELGFLRTYIFSTDHKMIGRQFLFLGLLMMILGGLLALVVRWQLAWPETAVPGLQVILKDTGGIIDPAQYNMAFTMHATIMIFFVIMPILAGGFGNFLIPLMIGARDMAFPFLNMLSFWVAMVAGVLMLAGFFVEGGHAAAGWTSYAPLSAVPAYTGVNWGQNLWCISLFILGRLVDDGVDQLHHHHHQHAGARG